MVSRSLGIFAAVGALLLVQGVVAQSAVAVSATSGGLADAYDPGDENPTCALWDSTSLSKNFTADFYAGDEERSFDTEAERDQWIRDNCGFEPNIYNLGESYSPLQSDRSFSSPPGNATNVINRQQFRNASFRNGYYTEREVPYPPLLMDYGQARVFSIENATRIHTGNGTTKMAIPEQGTLYGMFHYNYSITDRIAGPNPPSGIEPPLLNETSYNVTGGTNPFRGPNLTPEYVTACVAINGGNCTGTSDATTAIRSENINRGPCYGLDNSCNRSGRIVMEYDISDYDAVNSITFRVKINQTAEEERYVCDAIDPEFCYEDYPSTGDRTEGAWSLTNEKIFSRNTTLTQTVEITQSRPQAEMEIAVFPDGSREFRVSEAQGLRAMQFSDGSDQRLPDAIEYQYRYFSAGDPSWDGLEHQPVVMHAYPARVYDTYPAWDPPSVVAEAYGDTRGFTLPANVDVERASRFVEVDELIVGEVDSFARSEVRLYGIPPGTTASFDDIETSTRQVEKANLTAEVVGGNQTHAVIEIELVDEDGNPVYTRNRPGVIFVDGRKVDTNPNGKVTVVQRRLGGVRAQYRPTPWYKLPRSTQAYTASQDRAYPGLGRGLLNFILYLIKRTAPLWGAVLIGLYLVDKLPDADTWPPWKVIR